MFPHLRNKLYHDYTLPVEMEFVYKNNDNGEIVHVHESEKTPISRFPASQFTKLLETAHVQVSLL